MNRTEYVLQVEQQVEQKRTKQKNHTAAKRLTQDVRRIIWVTPVPTLESLPITASHSGFDEGEKIY